MKLENETRKKGEKFQTIIENNNNKSMINNNEKNNDATDDDDDDRLECDLQDFTNRY